MEQHDINQHVVLNPRKLTYKIFLLPVQEETQPTRVDFWAKEPVKSVSNSYITSSIYCPLRSSFACCVSLQCMAELSPETVLRPVQLAASKAAAQVECLEQAWLTGKL